MNRITRREFLIRSALLTASATLADSRWLMADGRWALSDQRSAISHQPSAIGHEPVVVARGADYARKLQQAVGKLGGERAIAGRGERVVIKPTLAWNRAPGQGANVHPEVLRATIEMALQAGARQVVLFDRTSLPSHFAYGVSGADQVVREINDPRVLLAHLTEEDFVPFAEGRGTTDEERRTMNHQPSAIGHQPSAISHQPCAIWSAATCWTPTG